MKQSSLVVTDSSTEAGAVVYWSLHTGAVNYDQFCAAWVQAGNPVTSCPPAPSPETALRRAVATRASKRRLARPLGGRRGRWSVVQETAIDEDLDYSQLVRAYLAEGMLIVDGDYTEGEHIREAYNAALGLLTQDDISVWVVNTLAAYYAIRLKPNGGIYYVPPGEAARFEKIAGTIEKISKKLITIEYIPAMNRDTVVRAVLDGLVDETIAFVDKMDDLLEKGMGKRAMQTRVAECDDQITRMSAYESILGSRVAKLQDAIGRVKARATLAALAAGNEE